MQLKPQQPITRTCPEEEIFEEVLDLDGKHILDLGCGSAQLTRSIAASGRERRVVALDVDEIQHQKNMLLNLPNVRFALAGAQKIPADDASFDVVFMFKSLHHVPLALMDQSLAEIHRVLKPDGIAYIAEPIFDGDFNNMLKLVHNDESVTVRQAAFEAAFEAIQRAVGTGKFKCKDEIFFNYPSRFQNFADFQDSFLHVTHTHHSLDDNAHVTHTLLITRLAA